MLRSAKLFLIVTYPPYGLEHVRSGVTTGRRLGKAENDDCFDWTESYARSPYSYLKAPLPQSAAAVSVPQYLRFLSDATASRNGNLSNGQARTA